MVVGEPSHRTEGAQREAGARPAHLPAAQKAPALSVWAQNSAEVAGQASVLVPHPLLVRTPPPVVLPHNEAYIEHPGIHYSPCSSCSFGCMRQHTFVKSSPMDKIAHAPGVPSPYGELRLISFSSLASPL